MSTDNNEQYDIFKHRLASRYGGLAAHFIRRWRPYQMHIDDNIMVNVFAEEGIEYDPSDPKWWQFWKKSKEQKFIEAISKIST